MKNMLRGSLIAVAAFALTGCAASHGTSPKGLEIPIEKAAIKFAADTKPGTYKVVTTEELKKWLDEKKAMVIVSALPAEEDASFGKLPGAVNGMIPKTEKELTPADKERIIKAAGPEKGRLFERPKKAITTFGEVHGGQTYSDILLAGFVAYNA